MSRIHEKKVTFELFEIFFRGVTKIFQEFYTDLESTQKIIKNTPKQVFEKVNFWWAASAKSVSPGHAQTSLYRAQA